LRDEVEHSAAEADARAVARANLDLHRYVAELSDNEFVVDALSRVWDRIAIATLTNVTDRDWSETMHRHHRDLVDAIVAGDGARAAAVAGEHVQQAAAVHRSSTEGDR
jgi:DNA-binding GntR family transcriptional regulator